MFSHNVYHKNSIYLLSREASSQETVAPRLALALPARPPLSMVLRNKGDASRDLMYFASYIYGLRRVKMQGGRREASRREGLALEASQRGRPH